jgi:hypothetical protein
MILEHSTKKPAIHGLLLLDCWEPQVRGHFFKDKFYINLIENLEVDKFRYIVNSASRLKIELNDPVMANTIKVCNYRDDHLIIRNLLANSGDEKSSTLLSRYVFNQNTVNVINFEDFVWFCTKYLSNKIQHWLVVGHTWQMCTHEHALGLPKLADLSASHNLNFYATDHSFCTLTEQTATLKDFEQDSMNWRLIEGFGYQLLPQSVLGKY